VDKSFEILQKYAKQNKMVLYIGTDIETTGLDPRASGAKILVLGISYAPNKVFVYPANMFPSMRRIFETLQFSWIWHNGKFDTTWLQLFGFPARVDHDIMLLHYCLNEIAGTHDLEQLSQLLLGAEAYKKEANQYIKSKEGFGSAPKEVLYERVAVDADYTRQLFTKLYPIVANDDNLSKLYHYVLLPASNLLTELEIAGMLVDPPYLHTLEEVYQKQIADLVTQIQAETDGLWDRALYMRQTGAKSAPTKFNPGSPLQLAWLVFDRLKLKPTKKKKRSTDVDVLESIQQNIPFIKSILKLRSVQKEYSTYVVGLLKRMDSTNRVHSTYGLHITATGRLSSKNPNLQNIPSKRLDIRKAFIVPKGYKLMECDYQGAELRVLAHMSGVGKLGEALIAGKDLHTDLAAELYPNFKERYYSEDKAIHQAAKNQRMVAKTVNFGVPYGREAFSIAQEFDIPTSEAQALIKSWSSMYPEAWEYLQSCAEQAAQGKVLVTPFGRMRRFGLITPETLHSIQNEARNFRIQSISSDLTLLSAIRIQPRIKPLGARIINLVHDSIVIEVPDDMVVMQKVASIVKEEMSATPFRELGSKVPFGVDIEYGDNWGEVEDFKYEEDI
jgi:DNA polymerase-1